MILIIHKPYKISNDSPYGEVSNQWNSFSGNDKGKIDVAFYVEKGGDVV